MLKLGVKQNLTGGGESEEGGAGAICRAGEPEPVGAGRFWVLGAGDGAA